MALTMLHLSLLSMNILNKAQTAMFTLLMHLLLQRNHISIMYCLIIQGCRIYPWFNAQACTQKELYLNKRIIIQLDDSFIFFNVLGKVDAKLFNSSSVLGIYNDTTCSKKTVNINASQILFIMLIYRYIIDRVGQAVFKQKKEKKRRLYVEMIIFGLANGLLKGIIPLNLLNF